MSSNQIELSRRALPTLFTELPNPAKDSGLHGCAEVGLHGLNIVPAMSPTSRVNVHQYHSSLRPYEKLPTELVREIIQLCVPLQLCFPLEHGSREPHLQITQICSSWRTITFSLSTLWNLTFYHHYILESSVKLAKALLIQVSAPQISLAILNLKPASLFSRTLYQDTNVAINELIVPNSQRLNSLDLVLEGSQWDMISSLNFEHLVSLKLLLDGPIKPKRIGPPIFAPSLQAVGFYTSWFMDNVVDLLPGVPWPQLRCLLIHGRQSPGCILSLLAKCASLEICQIDLIIPQYFLLPVSLPNVPILLPCLQHLSFNFTSPTSIWLLPQLELPSIRSVEFSGISSINEELLPIFTAFLHAIADTIRVVEIMEDEQEISIGEDILSALSPVTHLLLTIGHTFPKSALSSIGAGKVLPNLEHLQFAISGTEDDTQGIVDMLLARSTCAGSLSHPVSHLRVVGIYCDDVSVRDRVEPQLQDLQLQGTEIVFLL